MLILTRPEKEIASSMQQIAAAGIALENVLAVPISHMDVTPVATLPTASAYIFTSRQALLAFQEGQGRGYDAYCVGSETAAAAESKGFQVRVIGDDDGFALADKIYTYVRACGTSPQTMSLIHFSGNDAGTLWYAPLQKEGFTLRQQQVYVTHYHPFSQETIARLRAIETEENVSVMALSTASLQRFQQNCINANIATNHWHLYALSPKTASAALTWRRLSVAKAPTLKSLIACYLADKS